MHQDRGIQGDHVVAALDHRARPLALHVVLEQHAVVAVVVGRCQAAIDLRRLEDEATPLAQRDDLLHGHNVFSHARNVAGVRLSSAPGGDQRNETDADLRGEDHLSFRGLVHLAHHARLGSPTARLAPFGTPILGAPMPIYEYKCDNGHTFEVMQRMSDDALTDCTVCGAPVQRLFLPVAIHFKGSGFYNTDYGKRKRGASAKEDGAKADSPSTDSKPETKSDSKPAPSSTSSD